jgi:protein-tyrosine phosphatase
MSHQNMTSTHMSPSSMIHHNINPPSMTSTHINPSMIHHNMSHPSMSSTHIITTNVPSHAPSNSEHTFMHDPIKSVKTKDINKNSIIELFFKLKLKNVQENNKITNLVIKNGYYGPTIRSAWLTNKILISTIPYNCKDVTQIINSGVNLFMSLRENDELYKFCTNVDSVIFIRFVIPDALLQSIENIKTQIDNLINFLTKSNNKIVIHCQDGHGPTGIFACILIAYYFFLPEVKNILNNLKLEKNIDKKINHIARDIFKKSQAYVMLITRLFKITDSIKYRNINEIIMPETDAEKLLVIEVIKSYINNYIRNGFFNINEIKNKNQVSYPYYDSKSNKFWECPKNVMLK